MKLPSLITSRSSLVLSVIILTLILVSWGSTGHYKISYSSALSFNPEMDQFNIWTTALADHASDADTRKYTDPDEGPRHYIDIDNYSEFTASGSIPQELAEVISLYGETFVYDQGVLPWATLKTYDSLVSSFQRLDWDTAVYFASDLGHYVADGHMPLHLTRNYNGQFTDNTGIHSRYESTMINAYVSQIEYEGMPIEPIADVNQYIFDYIYYNYTFMDSILAADDYAQDVSGSTSNSTYKEALWEATDGFTVNLFKDASHAIAELIYNAWLEAGSPSMTAEISENEGFQNLSNVFPNPFESSTKISYNLTSNSNIQLTILDTGGKIVLDIENKFKQKGNHSNIIDGSGLKTGIYFLTLKTDKGLFTRKIVKMN